MKTKEKYIAPTLEQEEYMVEGGFTNSLLINPDDANDYVNGFQTWEWEENSDNKGFGYTDNTGNNNGVGWDWD